MKKKFFFLFPVIIITIGVLYATTEFAPEKVIPHIFPNECVGCGDCYRICPVKGKAIVMSRGKAYIDLNKCIACERCIWICSYGAVRR